MTRSCSVTVRSSNRGNRSRLTSTLRKALRDCGRRSASSLRGVAMSSIGTKLLNSLRSIERPGDFCVGGIREIVMPTIDIDGVGRIAFPILPVQAERLAAIAEAAPYGRGEKTVVDREVRRTWQVDSAKVRIGGRHWDKTLASLVADIALGLGVSEPVAAEFYKLLVYDTVSCFVDHRDTEKVPVMFATMVLVLPSTHSGGELVIKHLGREVVLDARPEEPSEIGFAAFYADCVHEVRPVKTGCRLTLVYNLCFVGERRPIIAQSTGGWWSCCGAGRVPRTSLTS